MAKNLKVMKIIGRIAAILIAAVISVLAVQRVIRRMYDSGKKYITLPTGGDNPADGEE